jgi:hypothetical protein
MSEYTQWYRCKICKMTMQDWELDMHGLEEHGEPLEYEHFEEIDAPESKEAE